MMGCCQYIKMLLPVIFMVILFTHHSAFRNCYILLWYATQATLHILFPIVPSLSKACKLSRPKITSPNATDFLSNHSAGPNVTIKAESLLFIFGFAVVSIPALSCLIA